MGDSFDDTSITDKAWFKPAVAAWFALLLGGGLWLMPPRIHDFVFPCHEDEVAGFSDSLDFLPLLLAAPIGSPDDVVAAFLRRSSRSHPDSDAFLVQAGKELATVLSGQFQRINGILKRLAP